MKDELVTIARFSNSIDAHLAKNKLESEGVLSFLFDENVVSINPLYNITVGGIKLKTLASDAEKAQAILKSVEDLPYTDELEMPITCPRCGSHKVNYAYNTSNRFRYALSVLLNIVLPFLNKNKYTCSNCGLEFQPEK
ncbi:putative signal transducing protein [Rufibacter roseus]|uniref:DUF2007 domain-containing protein n=1 Tax=Rufibacter roseus TaxID=1567108 RepID=A0ABW2DPH7_9BACT|nr:DUF2007 domain-containing protein [Rufibacter roseus]